MPEHFALVVSASSVNSIGTNVVVARKVALTPEKADRLRFIRIRRTAMREKARVFTMKIKKLRLKVAKSAKKATRLKYRMMIKELLQKKSPYLKQLKKLRILEAKLLGVPLKKRKKHRGSHRKHKHHMVKVRGSYVEATRVREEGDKYYAWNWNEGGFNGCWAKSKKEAIKMGNQMAKFKKLTVNEDTVLSGIAAQRFVKNGGIVQTVLPQNTEVPSRRR